MFLNSSGWSKCWRIRFEYPQFQHIVSMNSPEKCSQTMEWQSRQIEFYTLKNPRTEHIRHITIRGDRNNNKMERMNGEVRDREKVMRGLKKTDSPILKGYQVFHNYIRPHEGLDGKTPSEACGIVIEGQDKWKTLIQNATKKKN